MKLINKETALINSPETSINWREMNETKRLDQIQKKLDNSHEYKNFQVLKAPDNGQIVLKTDLPMEANVRGLFLLKLEHFLKKNIDNGISLWLEPVGDKSKLRNLRGISLKSI